MSISNEFQPRGKYNIGISALVETTTLPPTFVEGLNRMNVNFVMSNFNKEVATKTEYIKKNPNGTSEPLKVNVPIDIVGWGIDTSIYKKTEEKNISVEEELSKIPETFAFFFSGQWTNHNYVAERKGIPILIDVFLKTFAGVENPPCLILKTNGAQIGTVDRHDIITKLNEITSSVKHQLPNAKLPNIYVIYGQLSDSEMNCLFCHPKMKVFVSMSHGESWGFSSFHASCVGLPVLSVNWGGVCEYLNPQYCDFLEHQLVDIPVEAKNDWFCDGAKWANIIPDKAIEKMKSYFFNYTKEIVDNAEKLRIENCNKFSLDKMDERFHQLLDKYIPDIPRQSQIILPRLKKIELPKLRKIE